MNIKISVAIFCFCLEKTLYSLRKEHFEHICLPHSNDMHPDSILVEGKSKLEAYIKYREDRDKSIL